MPLPGFSSPQSTANQTISGIGQPATQGPPSNNQGIFPNYNLDDISYVAAEMLNQGHIAEGSIVPPPQSGTYRVPAPTYLYVGTTSTVNKFVLKWLDVDPSRATIGGYRIFYSSSINPSQQPAQIGIASLSPAVVYIPQLSPATITFYVQPFLSSGLTLPLVACPTTTAVMT